MSHLPKCLRTRRFSEPTSGPSWATQHWKNTVLRDFPTCSRTCIYSLLTFSSLIFSLLTFSSLIFSLLTFLTSAFQLSIFVGSFTSKLPSISSFPWWSTVLSSVDCRMDMFKLLCDVKIYWYDWCQAHILTIHFLITIFRIGLFCCGWPFWPSMNWHNGETKHIHALRISQWVRDITLFSSFSVEGRKFRA